MTSKRDAWASEKIAIEAELREEASRKEKEARDMLEKQFAERERQATEEMSIAIRRLDEKAEKESLASAQLVTLRLHRFDFVFQLYPLFVLQPRCIF